MLGDDDESGEASSAEEDSSSKDLFKNELNKIFGN